MSQAEEHEALVQIITNVISQYSVYGYRDPDRWFIESHDSPAGEFVAGPFKTEQDAYFALRTRRARAVLAVIGEKAKEWPTDVMLDVCRDEWRKRVNNKVATGTIGRDVDEPFRANWRVMIPASPLVKPEPASEPKP